MGLAGALVAVLAFVGFSTFRDPAASAGLRPWGAGADGRAAPAERAPGAPALNLRGLSEVAGELRLAARNAAAVTSEQSSAVAQTSATIEELAATAGSIADNAHAVAKAAEQTGDTMRDMQEKVEAIAERRCRSASARRRSARSSS